MDAVSSLNSVKVFFGGLETLYTFLTTSLPRYKILEEEQQKMLDGPDTRWASRKRAADAVIQSSTAIQEALDHIRVHRGSSPKAASEADGLLKKVRTFEFTLMLTSWNTLLKKIFALSNYLQQESFDVNTAVQLIDACMLQITELRSLEAFVAMENMARDLATLCKGATDYLQDRVRKKKKTFLS